MSVRVRPAPGAGRWSPAGDEVRVAPGRVAGQGWRVDGAAASTTAAAAGAETGGDREARAEVVDRVLSSGDFVPGGEGDEGAGTGVPQARLGAGQVGCAGMVKAMRVVPGRGEGDSVEQQARLHADTGHGMVAQHGGVGRRPDTAIVFESISLPCEDHAADGLVAAAGGLDGSTWLDGAGLDLVRADAAGGLGVGGDGDHVALVRGWPGGCGGRGGAGRGDEQAA